MVFALTKKANTNILLQAEAEGLLWACLIAVNYELENIILEYDCEMVTDAFSLPLNVPWSIDTAIVEVRSLLEGKPFWSIKWVKRNANRAPHVLSRWSLLNSI